MAHLVRLWLILHLQGVLRSLSGLHTKGNSDGAADEPCFLSDSLHHSPGKGK